MNAHRHLGAILLLLAAGTTARPAFAGEQPAPNFTISGPYTCQNLAIYLLHGKDTVQMKNVLTLQQALEQKLIVVHETGTVSQLAVENMSTDSEIFIQSGDIVKGGRQDRVLAYDLIVPVKSGRVPISSFCVEQSRWQQRGTEASDRFTASSGQLPGKGLRLAVSSARQQGQVWEKVKEQQDRLSKKLNKNVADAQSPTSLQLTLEDKALQAQIDNYTDKLSKSLEGKQDVIGCALAVNGKVECAEVYGSSVLFRKMWPKMLRAAAVDAFGDLQKGKKFEAADMEAVKGFLDAANKGKAVETKVTERIRAITWDSESGLCIESRDGERKGRLVHRSYIAK